MAFIDLNTITKAQFVDELICCDDCDDFYYPREAKLASMDFDFDEMKIEFEQWLIKNCDF